MTEITDEMVEASARALFDAEIEAVGRTIKWDTDWPAEPHRSEWLNRSRAALTAALGARPAQSDANCRCDVATGECQAPAGCRVVSAGLAVRAAPAAAWQPIETAPKDGTAVIITNGTAVGEASYFPDDNGWWWANCHPTDATDNAVWDATYWQPMPALPGADLKTQDN